MSLYDSDDRRHCAFVSRRGNVASSSAEVKGKVDTCYERDRANVERGRLELVSTRRI